MSKKKLTRKYLQCAVPGERADAVAKYMPLPNPSREYTQTKMSFSGIDRTHPFSMSDEASNIIFDSGVPVSAPSEEEILERYEYIESVHGFNGFFIVFYLKLVTLDESTGETAYSRFVDYIVPRDDAVSTETRIPTEGVDGEEYDSTYDLAPNYDVTFTSFASYGIEDEGGIFPDKLPNIKNGASAIERSYVENHSYYSTSNRVERKYDVYSARVSKRAGAYDEKLEKGESSEKIRTAVLFNTASNTTVVTNVEFSQCVLVFPDRYRLCLEDTEEGSKNLTVEYLGDAYPELCSAAAFNGRLYGVDKKGVIYVSKYNRYDGWELDTSGDISSSNAWISHTQTNPLSGTEFMTVIPYASRVLALKNGMTYTIYGSSNPFRVRESMEKGTVDARSVCVVSDVLFFLARDGVYAFDSSSLSRISDVLGISEFENGIAATANGRYYLYTCGELFVYDLSSKAWSTFDTEGVIYGLASVGGEIYAVYSDGRLARLVSPINKRYSRFSVTTAGLIGGTLADRRIKEINLICEVSEESSVHVSVILCGSDGRTCERALGGVYSSVGLIKKRYRVNLPSAMCEKIKISGYGRARIIALDVSHTFTV